MIVQDPGPEALGRVIDANLLDQLAHVERAHLRRDLPRDPGHLQRAVAGAHEDDGGARLHPFLVDLARVGVHLRLGQLRREAVAVGVDLHDARREAMCVDQCVADAAGHVRAFIEPRDHLGHWASSWVVSGVEAAWTTGAHGVAGVQGADPVW